MRDYVKESEDVAERKYAYDFDDVLRRYMIRAFKPFFRPGRALELGCYKGEFTELVSPHYPDLTVIEAATNLVEIASARLRGRATFIHSTFEAAKVEGQFDAIFLVHTLEHLDDPIIVLKRINSWLSPEGHLFLVVPNANAPSRQIAVKMGLISHNAAVTDGEAKHGHRCTYSLDTLERDAIRGGLSVLNRGGVFFKPFANFQFDKLMKTEIITEAYLDGCFDLGMQYPDLCASIYLICGKGSQVVSFSVK